MLSRKVNFGNQATGLPFLYSLIVHAPSPGFKCPPGNHHDRLMGCEVAPEESVAVAEVAGEAWGEAQVFLIRSFRFKSVETEHATSLRFTYAWHGPWLGGGNLLRMLIRRCVSRRQLR
jgi:hypothetical protein